MASHWFLVSWLLLHVASLAEGAEGAKSAGAASFRDLDEKMKAHWILRELGDELLTGDQTVLLPPLFGSAPFVPDAIRSPSLLCPAASRRRISLLRVCRMLAAQG